MAELRPVPGYPDYSATSDGRIWSDKLWHGTRGRWLKGCLDSKGYHVVGVRVGGRQYLRKVHQLVMRAWKGEPPEGMEVLHGDGDPLNNDISNLRYGTSSENKRDTVRHGRNPSSKKTHCPQGHPYDEENTLIVSGNRRCRICNQKRCAGYKARKVSR